MLLSFPRWVKIFYILCVCGCMCHGHACGVGLLPPPLHGFKEIYFRLPGCIARASTHGSSSPAPLYFLDSDRQGNLRLNSWAGLASQDAPAICLHLPLSTGHVCSTSRPVFHFGCWGSNSGLHYCLACTPERAMTLALES